MRVTLGSTLMMEGAAYLSGPEVAQPLTLVARLLEVVVGASILLGCMTPLACILVGLGGGASRLAGVPDVLPIGGGLALLFASSMAAAVLLLGPGAFSLDARLFGRRRVIIPRASHTPKS